MREETRHVAAWYSYAFAAEVFSACALAIFLPITLERMARDIGFWTPELSIPCIEDPPTDDIEKVCKAFILWGWVDTASFSMYVKSIAVASQAIAIISIGPLADDPRWRKRLLLLFAYTGAISAIVFLAFPASPRRWLPLAASLLTVVGNVGYATSIVCANAFLPQLARETLSPNPPETLETTSRAVSTVDLAVTDPGPKVIAHANDLSLRTSRISSYGTALGFLSGFSVLALLMIPVSLGGGSVSSLRLAIGITGIWWAVFTIPSWIGLPTSAGITPFHSSHSQVKRQARLKEAWHRVARMVRWSAVKRLPNLYTFLLAWIFLSDGFHTTTYTAILYASSTLHLSATKIIVIGLLTQLAAVFSSVLAPRIQHRATYSNSRLLLFIVILAPILPIYACLGLILPFGGLRTEGEMYVAGIWFGMLYGPFNSYARAVYAELIPPGHESSFFSLFSLTDKSASFIGPFVVGIIADKTGNIRLGFLFLLVMLALPIPVLIQIDVRAGAEEARLWLEGKDQTEDASEGDALLHEEQGGEG